MPKTMFHSVFRLGVAFTAVFIFGCSQEQKVEPTLSSLWEHEFQTCGVTCHSANAADGTDLGPDLSTQAKFYGNLVNKNVVSNFSSWVKTGDCNSVDFVEPGNAARSTLAASLLVNYHDTLAADVPCTSSYNIHVSYKAAITDSAVADALVAWINNGAKND